MAEKNEKIISAKASLTERKSNIKVQYDTGFKIDILIINNRSLLRMFMQKPSWELVDGKSTWGRTHTRTQWPHGICIYTLTWNS